MRRSPARERGCNCNTLTARRSADTALSYAISLRHDKQTRPPSDESNDQHRGKNGSSRSRRRGSGPAARLGPELTLPYEEVLAIHIAVAVRVAIRLRCCGGDAEASLPGEEVFTVDVAVVVKVGGLPAD